MPKKSKPEIRLGDTARPKTPKRSRAKLSNYQRTAVHMWEEKWCRVASGDLVYNVPAGMLPDSSKANQIVETVSCFDLFRLLSAVIGRRFLRLQGPLQSSILLNSTSSTNRSSGLSTISSTPLASKPPETHTQRE